MKKEIVLIEGKNYLRIPVKTRILSSGEDIVDIIREYTDGLIEKGDVIVISESPLAITQGRAVAVEDIKIGFLASFLWRFVGKVSYNVQ